MVPTTGFVLIGCGKIGVKHAALISRYARLVAVCDTNVSKADNLAELYGSKAFYHLNDLISQTHNATIAVICTPNGLHAEHTVACMQAGMHVLCEKPLSIRYSDGQWMQETALATKKKLWVVKQNRFNPPVMLLKKLLANQQLGKISSFQVNCLWNRPESYYQHEWHGSRELDGGVLFTQFSHFIDLIYWLLGDVKSVKATIKNHFHQHQIEDCGVVMMELENGAIGSLNYTVNTFRKNMEGSITVIGEKGTVKIGGPYLNKLEYADLEVPLPILPDVISSANEYGDYQGSMSNHHLVYEQLMQALNEEAHLLTDVHEGLKTVEIIEKIYTAGGY